MLLDCHGQSSLAIRRIAFFVENIHILYIVELIAD